MPGQAQRRLPPDEMQRGTQLRFQSISNKNEESASNNEELHKSKPRNIQPVS